MAILKQVRPTEIFMGKLKHGADLMEEITGICREKGIHLGKIEAFGAVKKARLGYYNQESREYLSFDLDRPMEITKLIGNVSIKPV